MAPTTTGTRPSARGHGDVDDLRALGLGELGGLTQEAEDGEPVDAGADDELDEPREAGLVDGARLVEGRGHDVVDAVHVLPGCVVYGSARTMPPSTGTMAPVTYEAAGDSRNAATRPISAVSP